MQRKGNSFILTVNADIFKQGLYPYLVISQNDLEQTEKNESLHIDNLKNQVYPYLAIDLLGLGHPTRDNYIINGTIESYMKPPEFSTEPLEYTGGRLLIKVDDTIIKDESIEIFDFARYEIDEEIPLEEGQTCTLSVIVKDNINLEHHYLLDTYTRIDAENQKSANGEVEELVIRPDMNELKIFSPDGILLWTEEL